MSRLRAELGRLYGHQVDVAADGPASMRAGTDPSHACRALVLEVAAPADWRRVGAVWRGVQDELGLGAPAIAVNGRDGMQLWFATVEHVDVARAQAFLEGLRKRYLGDVPAHRVRSWPAADPAPAALPPVPAEQACGNWSAFVAPDLAPLFAETPWLDIPPGEEAQASLLSGLTPIEPRAFAGALAALGEPAASHAGPATAPAPVEGGAAVATSASAWRDPREFLLAVMNDPQAPLALRVEAAKALLAAPAPASGA